MPEDMIPAEEFIRLAYNTEWWKVVDFEEAREYHARNVEDCREALEEYFDKDRPIRVLVVHGSGRSSVELSCAHEPSNSQMLLRDGLTDIEHDPDVEVEEINLREYKIEYCNNCYSTTSALCGYPCDCFILDPMQQLYPKVLRCDAMLMSTGVNQSAMSSRLKAFSDRLISLDGGYYRRVDQVAPKDSEFRTRMIATSREQDIFYDQRMHGRVAAFFLSSKDDADEELTGDAYYDSLPHYIESVAAELYRGFWDFGWYFADPWSAAFIARPNEELSFDKQRLNEDLEAQQQARNTVRAAVDLAREFRQNPPEPRPHPVGRT